MNKNLVRNIGLAIALIIVVIAVYYFSSNSPKATPVKSPQEVAIESKGLAEFNSENNTINTASSEDKKMAEEMMPIFKLMGNAKDTEKNKEAATALGKIVEKYPEYSDAHLLRATVLLLVGSKDYQNILVDIDDAIKFHSSEKYKSAYDSTVGMYSLRTKVDILTNNQQQAISDLETAIKIDPSKINDIFNTGGVKPEDASNPTALQKSDLDSLIAKYPDDYRTYMFRGLFYNSFTVFDEKYYVPVFDDLKRAQQLNPNSVLANYFLGFVYEQNPTRTKAGWSDISGWTGASGGYRDKINSIALQYFQRVIELDPTFTDAYYKAASLLYGLKRYSEAIPYYDKAIGLDPNNAGVYNDRGLAKTYTEDYYGAISDFTQAADLKKSKADAYLDMTYKNRADAYVKVANYDSAIADYSRAIGLDFGRATISMSISQIRAIYPELNVIPDQDLVEGLRQKYYPNISFEDFAKSLLHDNKEYTGGTSLADAYISRGDTYLAKGNFRNVAKEYTRAISENHYYADIVSSNRWKIILRNPDISVDTQTLDFTKGNTVSLWLKSVSANSKSYSEQNYQIDCSGKRIKSVSLTDYDAYGDAMNTTGEQGWQSIVPESIGEVLHNGMCQNG